MARSATRLLSLWQAGPEAEPPPWIAGLRVLRLLRRMVLDPRRALSRPALDSHRTLLLPQRTFVPVRSSAVRLRSCLPSSARTATRLRSTSVTTTTRRAATSTTASTTTTRSPSRRPFGPAGGGCFRRPPQGAFRGTIALEGQRLLFSIHVHTGGVDGLRTPVLCWERGWDTRRPPGTGSRTAPRVLRDSEKLFKCYL